MIESSRIGRPARRLATLTLACLAWLGAVSGCHGSHLPQQSPLPQPALLVVRNQGYFDVNIYVLPSSGGSGVRLATVPGNSGASLKVSPNQLQMGYVLAIRLHAIGSRYWWDTPTVTMDESTVAHLDITSDPDGNLSRSSLYTSVLDPAVDTVDYRLR